MNINEHAQEVKRTASAEFKPYTNVDLLHAAIGAAGEAGELLDAVKRGVFYGRDLDVTNVIEEIGDMYWYLGLACNAIGVLPTQVLAANSAKLRARYPEKFDGEQAVNRDVKAEETAMKEAV